MEVNHLHGIIEQVESTEPLVQFSFLSLALAEFVLSLRIYNQRRQ